MLASARHHAKDPRDWKHTTSPPSRFSMEFVKNFHDRERFTAKILTRRNWFCLCGASSVEKSVHQA
jgi:hypothetical protein